MRTFTTPVAPEELASLGVTAEHLDNAFITAQKRSLYTKPCESRDITYYRVNLILGGTLNSSEHLTWCLQIGNNTVSYITVAKDLGHKDILECFAKHLLMRAVVDSPAVVDAHQVLGSQYEALGCQPMPDIRIGSMLRGALITHFVGPMPQTTTTRRDRSYKRYERFDDLLSNWVPHPRCISVIALVRAMVTTWDQLYPGKAVVYTDYKYLMGGSILYIAVGDITGYYTEIQINNFKLFDPETLQPDPVLLSTITDFG